tara:strand:+ start:643 stop:1236 length:594 start_codon:yes stop_codon:yes gene_type:complete
MKKKTSKPIIHTYILAAGQSSRFGKTKLTQIFRGLPLVQHPILAAKSVCKDRVSLIVGHDASSVIKASGDLVDIIISNSNFKKGLGSSISTAVSASKKTADAILIILGDQPFVSAQDLNMILDAWSGSSDEIVASSYDGIEGPPILFPKTTYQYLEDLSEDYGAKYLIKNDEFNLKKIKIPSARYDIDTQQDFDLLN